MLSRLDFEHKEIVKSANEIEMKRSKGWQCMDTNRIRDPPGASGFTEGSRTTESTDFLSEPRPFAMDETPRTDSHAGCGGHEVHTALAAPI
jgi:hypothetical protein